MLSFKHQISLMDERVFNGAGTAADRGVVQLQVAGADPAAGGDWLTLVPFWNVYDKRHHTTYINCSFDPVDDGNTEEAFFDPADPQRRFGPSSTCYPAPVFAHLGDTGAPFDPGNIGAASDGPGLEGSAGTGTWVESRFDLARFRGRSVRLRLLVSTTKVSSALTWESGFINDWGARDDGWFLDAVSVTDTLVEPASLMADTKDNSALKQDWDLDGFGATCDCNPVDETAWSLPGEARDLRLSQAGGFPGTTTFYWDPPSDPGGTTMAYGVLRATTPAGWAAAECLPLDDPGTPEAQDPTVPSAVFYYLVRAENSCGAGSPGDAVPAPQAAASCAEANR